MIQNISMWAKSIAFSVIIVSILEMLLPNNKTKKYVKMVMGLFVIYNIIFPLINNKEMINFDHIDIESITSSANINLEEVNQESMDKRLQELYIEELEKDVTKKVEKQGYIVKSCKVRAKISDNEKETGIEKIKLKVERNFNQIQDEGKENLEDKVINEIQKIKKVDTNISKPKDNSEDIKIQNSDIQNLKRFLIQEYEVNEKCLEIN